MSREIEFRATRKDTKETFEVLGLDWIHSTVFLAGHMIEVDMESVVIQQFSGKHDRDGIKIFEGDIVHFEQDDFDFYFEISLADNGCFVARNHIQKSDFYFLDDFEYKVIGNIHQNPELLEVAR